MTPMADAAKAGLRRSTRSANRRLRRNSMGLPGREKHAGDPARLPRVS
jgi:hypothetical protein